MFTRSPTNVKELVPHGHSSLKGLRIWFLCPCILTWITQSCAVTLKAAVYKLNRQASKMFRLLVWSGSVSCFQTWDTHTPQNSKMFFFQPEELEMVEWKAGPWSIAASRFPSYACPWERRQNPDLLLNEAPEPSLCSLFLCPVALGENITICLGSVQPHSSCRFMLSRLIHEGSSWGMRKFESAERWWAGGAWFAGMRRHKMQRCMAHA